ncbi:MAG: DUF2461 domain-containing protein [Ruminococcus sp.]|nr:DUF2461 domain-containing protein [Ruminococcus sp.]
MPFSAKTLDFLFENRINDSKSWFTEHKEDYENYVKKPFKEFTERTLPLIREIDGQIGTVRISRIYRDARYAKGKSVFRENMWCTFGRTRDLYKSLPCFYFNISQKGMEYGCGFYCAASDTMDAFRRLIIDDSMAFISAKNAFEEQDVFTFYGEMYKRNRFPDESEEKRIWLNRRDIGLSALSTDFDMLFSDKLPEKISEDFNKIAPIYELFMKAEEMSDRRK